VSKTVAFAASLAALDVASEGESPLPLASMRVSSTKQGIRATLAPLKLPGFRPLAFAYTVNELGNWLGEIALAVLVFDETGSPLATAALFLGMQFLPALFAQGVVARVEVTGTRVGLPAIYATEAVTFIVLATLVDDFVLAAIVVLAAFDGTLALAGRAFTRAAAAAVLNPHGQLRTGNALLNVGFTAAGALGPLMGGLIVAGFGVETAFVLNAISFLLAALILFLARSVPSVKAAPERWWTRLREGLGYVGRRVVLRRLLIAQAAALLFFAAVVPVEIVYAKETLGTGSSGYGVLLASWGIGMVAGSVAFAAARRISLQPLLLGSTLAVGVSYLAMSTADSLLFASLVAAIGGIGNGIQWVSVISAIQGETDDAYQARVVGLLELGAAVMPGLGFALGGGLTELLDPRASFLAAGVGIIAVSAVAVPLLGRMSWGAAGQPRVDTTEAPATASAGGHVGGTQSSGAPRISVPG
jgi:MFS family permease